MNVQGNPGKNIPMDLLMEHLNPECNTAIAGLGATVTEQAVKRVDECLGEMITVMSNFDSHTGVPHESNTTWTEEKDHAASVGAIGSVSK